ncbi:hypothetical protein GCM10020218_080550 [Dactylosporangium vinaceum]
MNILSDIEDKPTTDAFILSQLQSIKYTAEYERSNGMSWSELLRGQGSNKSGTKTIRRLILGMGVQIMMQISGINVTSVTAPAAVPSPTTTSSSPALPLVGWRRSNKCVVDFEGLVKQLGTIQSLNSLGGFGEC